MDPLALRGKQSTEQAIAIHARVPRQEPATPRHRLARSALALALEHHASITTLSAVGNYSSAAALLRPLMEAGACAFWIVYACPPPLLTMIMAGERDTPTLPKMLQSLRKVAGLEGVDRLAEMLPREGRYLDSYTHGGMSQLGQRDWMTGFSSQRTRHTLMVADMFAVAAAAVATVIYDAPELFQYLGERRDQLRLETIAMSGRTVPDEPWRAFPKAPYA